LSKLICFYMTTTTYLKTLLPFLASHGTIWIRLCLLTAEMMDNSVCCCYFLNHSYEQTKAMYTTATLPLLPSSLIKYHPRAVESLCPILPQRGSHRIYNLLGSNLVSLAWHFVVMCSEKSRGETFTHTYMLTALFPNLHLKI